MWSRTSWSMIEYRYGFNAIPLPSMLFPRRKSEKEFVWYKRNDTDWYEEAKCIDFLVFIFARVSFVMYDTSIEKSEMLVVHGLYCKRVYAQYLTRHSLSFAKTMGLQQPKKKCVRELPISDSMYCMKRQNC